MLDFIFYNDRLLLKKDEEGHCHVPDETELPERWAQLTPHHEVLLPNGHMIRTAATDRPVDEDSRWTMTGLRASFDHVSLAEYKAAGKAFQILWWDRHSRFCPVCGTRTEQRAPIMKRCPACGYEIYPPISTAIIVLIRRGADEVLLVQARNFRGTFYGLVAGFLEPGETLEQCTGAVRGTRSTRRDWPQHLQHTLLRQPILALPQRTDGGFHGRLCGGYHQAAGRRVECRCFLPPRPFA